MGDFPAAHRAAAVVKDRMFGHGEAPGCRVEKALKVATGRLMRGRESSVVSHNADQQKKAGTLEIGL
jgi:hypothetical protein